MSYWTYILASKRNGTLYVGVTNDLHRRVREHKHNQDHGFTSRYKVHRLVWCEEHSQIGDAIHREKQIKKWRRAWKLELIEHVNPQWHDLFHDGD